MEKETDKKQNNEYSKNSANLESEKDTTTIPTDNNVTTSTITSNVITASDKDIQRFIVNDEPSSTASSFVLQREKERNHEEDGGGHHKDEHNKNKNDENVKQSADKKKSGGMKASTPGAVAMSNDNDDSIVRVLKVSNSDHVKDSTDINTNHDKLEAMKISSINKRSGPSQIQPGAVAVSSINEEGDSLQAEKRFDSVEATKLPGASTVNNGVMKATKRDHVTGESKLDAEHDTFAASGSNQDDILSLGSGWGQPISTDPISNVLDPENNAPVVSNTIQIPVASVVDVNEREIVLEGKIVEEEPCYKRRFILFVLSIIMIVVVATIAIIFTVFGNQLTNQDEPSSAVSPAASPTNIPTVCVDLPGWEGKLMVKISLKFFLYYKTSQLFLSYFIKDLFGDTCSLYVTQDPSCDSFASDDWAYSEDGISPFEAW